MKETILIILNSLVIIVLLPMIGWAIKQGINLLIKKIDQLIEAVVSLNIKDAEHDLEIKALKVKSREHTEQLKEHSSRIQEIKENQLTCKNNVQSG